MPPDPMPVNVSLAGVTPGYMALAAGTVDIPGRRVDGTTAT